MDAKEQAFRESAKAEGYSEDQIAAHLSNIAPQSKEPTLPASNTYEDFTKTEIPQARTAVSRMKESASDTGTIAPYAIGAGATAATLAAGATAKKVYDTLTKKMEDSGKTESIKPTSSVPQEPTFDWQNFKPADVMGNAPALPETTPTTGKPSISDLQQRLGITPPATTPNAIAPVLSPVPVALPATPVVQISSANTAIPANDAAITNDLLATPQTKAEARVNTPENSNVKPFNIVKDSPKVTFGDIVANDAEILKNRQELRNTVSNLHEIRSPDNGKTFYVVDHNGEWGTKAFASEAEAQQELTKIQNKIKNPIAETPVKGAVAPRAERGSLAGAAMNPAPVEGQPGMREQYNIPKGINPATGEKFMGPGGFNYLTGQVGPERASQAWEEQYGKRNVPAKQVIADYAATRYPPTAVTAEGKSGGAFEKPKYIPDYIKGAATIGGMANAGLNALGVAGLISDFKEAKKTGDWSNFGLNATGQAIANLVPKAALPAQLATYSKALGESPEELKALGKKLQDAQQAFKVGAGRGMQGVPPPSNR